MSSVHSVTHLFKLENLVLAIKYLLWHVSSAAKEGLSQKTASIWVEILIRLIYIPAVTCVTLIKPPWPTSFLIHHHLLSRQAHGECPRWAKLGLDECQHHHSLDLNPSASLKASSSLHLASPLQPGMWAASLCFQRFGVGRFRGGIRGDPWCGRPRCVSSARGRASSITTTHEHTTLGLNANINTPYHPRPPPTHASLSAANANHLTTSTSNNSKDISRPR